MAVKMKEILELKEVIRLRVIEAPEQNPHGHTVSCSPLFPFLLTSTPLKM
jgi:hypothetical protein